MSYNSCKHFSNLKDFREYITKHEKEFDGEKLLSQVSEDLANHPNQDIVIAKNNFSNKLYLLHKRFKLYYWTHVNISVGIPDNKTLNVVVSYFYWPGLWLRLKTFFKKGEDNTYMLERGQHVFF